MVAAHGSATSRLLGLWIQISSGPWMSVVCECFVLSGRDMRRAGPSFREGLPSVCVCVCVCVCVSLSVTKCNSYLLDLQ